MYNRNISNINKPLKEYFNEVIYTWNKIQFPMFDIELNGYLLSSLLLQMCGFIEQKYDSILWEIGYLVPSLRHELQKDCNSGTIDLEKYKKLYNNDNWIENDNSNFNEKISDNYNTLFNSKEIIDTLLNSPLRSELEYLTVYTISKTNQNDIKNMVKQSIEKRNEIAHFKQFYNPKNILSLHESELTVGSTPFNYLTAFTLLIAIDVTLTNLFHHINTYYISKYIYYQSKGT